MGKHLLEKIIKPDGEYVFEEFTFLMGAYDTVEEAESAKGRHESMNSKTNIEFIIK